ncbi:MAG: MmgE/PrpD family protein [Gammaproteobacteria bacterium]|nr:MmgE/PrpD family protein [Gammaproteobacteria bacterium]
MTQPLTQRFANWSVDLGIADIPDNVLNAARQAMFDTIGVTVAGMAHKSVEMLGKTHGNGSGKCSLVTGKSGSPTEAALINGTASHAWDFDDTSYTGIMHGSTIVFPAALAVAEELDCSEDELITAFVVGSEITYVLADICSHDHYFNGWFSSATFSLIGSTVACAKLYGLDVTQTTYAAGFAAAAAGGCRCLFGTDAKPYLIGETAKRSIEMALAAKTGLTGPVNAFEDKNGYFSLLNKGKAELSQVDTLGERWRLVDPGLLFKTSPVCSAAHAAIDQTAQLVKQHSIKSNDIESIEAYVPELVDISLVYDHPSEPQQAQFSMQYALACSVLHGRVRLQDLTLAEVTSPKKIELMCKVKKIVDADLSTEEMRALHPESARIKLTLKDGRCVEGFCGSAYGMPDNPLSTTDLSNKFTECVQFGKGKELKTSPTGSNVLELVKQCFS